MVIRLKGVEPEKLNFQDPQIVKPSFSASQENNHEALLSTTIAISRYPSQRKTRPPVTPDSYETKDPSIGDSSARCRPIDRPHKEIQASNHVRLMYKTSLDPWCRRRNRSWDLPNVARPTADPPMNHETRPWFDGCEFICDEEMKNKAFCGIGLKITLVLWDPRGLAPEFGIYWNFPTLQRRWISNIWNRQYLRYTFLSIIEDIIQALSLRISFKLHSFTLNLPSDWVHTLVYFAIQMNWYVPALKNVSVYIVKVIRWLWKYYNVWSTLKMRVLAITTIFTILSAIFVSIRLWTRFKLVRSPGLDDLFIFAALVCSGLLNRYLYSRRCGYANMNQ